MKRITAIVLMIILVFTLVACGEKQPKPTAKPAVSAQSTATVGVTDSTQTGALATDAPATVAPTNAAKPTAKPTASTAPTGEALRKQIVAWTAGRDYDKMNQTLHFTLEKKDEYGTYYATTAQAPGVNFVCRQSTDDHGEKHFSFDDIEAPASVLFPEYVGMDYGEIPYYLSMPKNYIVALRDPYGEYSIIVEDISVGDHVEEKLKADHLVRMLPN